MTIPERETLVEVDATTTVEAAPMPDVSVSVEPTPVNVSVDAPIVNVEAPQVEASFTAPAQAAPQVNVSVEPTPVTVENEINVDNKPPKPSRTRTTVHRGRDDLITGDTTHFEYDESD